MKQEYIIISQYSIVNNHLAFAPLHLSRILYKSTLFMQNKPNLPNAQMNVKSYNTTDYENIANWTLGQNKPNSNPIKPNFRKAKMDVSSLIAKDYEKNDDFVVRINKPNFRNCQNERKLNFNKGLQKKRLFSSQKNKPKTKPIQTQSNPVLSAVEWANFKPPGNEPKKLKRKRGYQELFCVSCLPERLTFWMDMIFYYERFMENFNLTFCGG